MMVAENDRLCLDLATPEGYARPISPRPLAATVKATALKSQARRQGGSRSPVRRQCSLEPADLDWASSFHRADSVDLLDRQWAENTASNREAKPVLDASQVDVSWLQIDTAVEQNEGLAVTNDELMGFFQQQENLVA
jgi:hypothetical protein